VTDTDSIVEIQQLAARYALAVDSRDLDGLVGLFVPDVKVGRAGVGRDALRSWYEAGLRTVGATIHFVGGHVVDLDGSTATGVVYCREEVEDPARGEWRLGVLQYWDDYRQVEGSWLFARRQVRRWYSADARSGPSRGAGLRPGERALPEAFENWADWES